MENEEFVKKVYLSSVEGPNRRGKKLGRWEGRVKEYVSERRVRGNGLEWARRECMNRERWRSVCRDHPVDDLLISSPSSMISPTSVFNDLILSQVFVLYMLKKSLELLLASLTTLTS